MSEKVTQEELMRYLDGELPPGERARVESALGSSTELARELELFRGMKRGLQQLSFTPRPHGDSVWDRVSRSIARPVGWVFFVLGIAAWSLYGAYVYTLSPVDPIEKLATGAVVIGILLLLASVIWERLQELPNDHYSRNVHR